LCDEEHVSLNQIVSLCVIDLPGSYFRKACFSKMLFENTERIFENAIQLYLQYNCIFEKHNKTASPPAIPARLASPWPTSSCFGPQQDPAIKL
jgi:hypothetical protein